MKTMRDFLVWYNNREVVPFLQAINEQFAFYQQHHIDMFKDGISVPGLTLLYLFNNLPSKTHFTVFNKTNSYLHQLDKNNIVGGLAIIFHRYHGSYKSLGKKGQPSIQYDLWTVKSTPFHKVPCRPRMIICSSGRCRND